MTLNASLTGANYTYYNLPEGNYVVRFWCNDSFNNINNTERVYPFLMDAVAQTGISGAIPIDTISNDTIYDTEVAEAKSVELTRSLKEFIDEIPITIKKWYNLVKKKVFSIGSLISPQNKERGVTILLAVAVISIFVLFRYNEYLGIKYEKAKDRLFGKAYAKIAKTERPKRIKYIDNI